MPPKPRKVYKTTPYARGRALEYKVKKDLEKEGCVVLRTAGSHGFADLVCIDPEDPTVVFNGMVYITFIQCKRVSSDSEAHKLARKFFDTEPLHVDKQLRAYNTVTRQQIVLGN